MRQVTFVALADSAGHRDGEGGWEVHVDSQAVCMIDGDELDIGENALAPLWDALGVTVGFDFDED